MTHDEFEYYKEMGYRMTLQSRYQRVVGHLPPSANDNVATAQQTMEPAAMTTQQLLISDSESNSSFAIALPGETLEQRFGAFLDIIKNERKEARETRRALSEPADPSQDASAEDSGLERLLSKFGGSSHLQGLRKNPVSASSVIDHFQWRIPIVPFVKVGTVGTKLKNLKT